MSNHISGTTEDILKQCLTGLKGDFRFLCATYPIITEWLRNPYCESSSMGGNGDYMFEIETLNQLINDDTNRLLNLQNEIATLTQQEHVLQESLYNIDDVPIPSVELEKAQSVVTSYEQDQLVLKDHFDQKGMLDTFLYKLVCLEEERQHLIGNGNYDQAHLDHIEKEIIVLTEGEDIDVLKAEHEKEHDWMQRYIENASLHPSMVKAVEKWKQYTKYKVDIYNFRSQLCEVRKMNQDRAIEYRDISRELTRNNNTLAIIKTNEAEFFYNQWWEENTKMIIETLKQCKTA